MAGMTVENMISDIMKAELIAHMLQVDALMEDIIKVPIDDPGIPEPLVEGGPFMAEALSPLFHCKRSRHRRRRLMRKKTKWTLWISWLIPRVNPSILQ